MDNPTEIVRVGLVEDRTEDRQRIEKLLSTTPGFACAAACASAEEAILQLPAADPDVVLMDIHLPGISGIHCLRDLKPRMPGTEFMMLTIFEDHERIFESLAAGATGYILKKTSEAKLLECIRELRDGGAPMSGQIARHVVAAFREQTPEPPAAARLSPTEQNVLQHLARGLLYKEIAAQLGITEATVRTHIWRIYRKLHVHNRTEAVLKGLPHPRG